MAVCWEDSIGKSAEYNYGVRLFFDVTDVFNYGFTFGPLHTLKIRLFGLRPFRNSVAEGQAWPLPRPIGRNDIFITCGILHIVHDNHYYLRKQLR